MHAIITTVSIDKYYVGTSKSVGIQCNLLNAPPLQKLCSGGSLYDFRETELIDTDLETQFDLESSFHCSQEEDSQDEHTTK